MTARLFLVAAAAMVAFAVAVPEGEVLARGGHRGSYHTSSSVRRDSNGRIHRSQSAKKAFLRQHGMTHVPKGQQVDHKVPLCAGGSDSPSNMQLLSSSQHRAKTRGDVQRCRRR